MSTSVVGGATAAAAATRDTPPCPRCRHSTVRRGHRTGVIEHLLSLLYVYPFRCQFCAHRFRVMLWGTRYRRRAVDRRELERAAVRFPGSLVSGREQVEGRVTQISLAGCTIETDALLAGGAVVQVQLRVEPSRQPIVVEAAVVRSVRLGAAGLEFMRVHPGEAARLREYVLGTLGYGEAVTSDLENQRSRPMLLDRL